MLIGRGMNELREILGEALKANLYLYLYLILVIVIMYNTSFCMAIGVRDLSRLVQAATFNQIVYYHLILSNVPPEI